MIFKIGKTYRFDKDKYIKNRGIERYQDGRKWINLIEDIEFVIKKGCGAEIYYLRVCHLEIAVIPEWCVEVKKNKTYRLKKVLIKEL